MSADSPSRTRTSGRRDTAPRHCPCRPAGAAPSRRRRSRFCAARRGLRRARPLDASGRPTNADTPPERLHVTNPSGYIDYQDCKYLGGQEALCSGLNTLPDRRRTARASRSAASRSSTSPPIASCTRCRWSCGPTAACRFQMPVELWTASGLPMTQNPFWIEPTAQRAARRTSCRTRSLHDLRLRGGRRLTRGVRRHLLPPGPQSCDLTTS